VTRDGISPTPSRRNASFVEQDQLRARRVPQNVTLVPEELSLLLTELLTVPNVPREVPNPPLVLSPVISAPVVTMLPAREISTVKGVWPELTLLKVLESVASAPKEHITPPVAPEWTVSNANPAVTQGERETLSVLPVPSVIPPSSMDPPTAPPALLENTSSSPVVPPARTANPDTRTPWRVRPSVLSAPLEHLLLTLQPWSVASVPLASSVLILPRQHVKFVPLEVSQL